MDLKEECERLKRIGSKGPSESARTILLDGLHSKWEGVQVTAARVLANWGDESSLTAVKSVLLDLSSKVAHWSSAGAIAYALAPHLHQRDIPWVLDFYFIKSKRTNRFALTRIFAQLPLNQTVHAIEQLALTQYLDPRDKKSAVGALKWYAKASRGDSNNSFKPNPLRGSG